MISICFHLSLLISSGDIPVFLAEDPVPEQGSPVVDSVVLQLLGAVPPVASRVFDDRFPVLSADGWVCEFVGLLDLSSLEEVSVHQQLGG